MQGNKGFLTFPYNFGNMVKKEDTLRIMSAVRFPLLAALLMSACGGNPLSGAGGGGSSAPVEGSVSTLSTTTTTPAASGSVERHEV